MSKVNTYSAATGEKIDPSCDMHICTDVPVICGSPPPPCNPCCDTPVMRCKPMPTRNAIKLRNGETGRYFAFQATNVSPEWYAHMHRMSLTLTRIGGDACCRSFCYAPSGVTHDGRVYYAWTKDFITADAGYYYAVFAVDGHTHRETVLFKPFAYVSVHNSWGTFNECSEGGLIVPKKGCGCDMMTCCTHLPEAIQEEFIDPTDCGGCNVGCN